MVPGTVVKKHNTPRSYIIETLGGKKIRRSRPHLKQTGASFHQTEPELKIPTGDTPLLNQTSNQQSSSQQSSSQQLLSQQSADKSSSQSTNSRQSAQLQSGSQKKCYETRSGRSVKPPSRFSDFVMDGKVNVIKEEKISEVFV